MKGILWTVAAGAAILALAGCGQAPDSLMSIKLTDAPVDSAGVTSVYVTVSGVAVNESADAAMDAGSWIEAPLAAPSEYDLLSLQNGLTSALGQVALVGGTQINQIRLEVSAAALELASDPGTRVPLSVNSGDIKIVNAFDIPVNGEISVVLDFDARKSLRLVQGGTGYLLTPVVRAIVEGEAGSISGTLALADPESYTVYAYPGADLFDVLADYAVEAAATETAPAFANAVTSAKPNDLGAYKLAFLAAGPYDLIAVPDAEAGIAPAASADEVIVLEARNTVQDLAAAPAE
jgi:hypothetical protein